MRLERDIPTRFMHMLSSSFISSQVREGLSLWGSAVLGQDPASSAQDDLVTARSWLPEDPS